MTSRHYITNELRSEFRAMTTTRRTKPPGCYAGTEAAFQRSAISLVRTLAHPQGVDPRAIIHIPNGSKRPLHYGAFVKAQGMVAGYPDIMMFKPVAVMQEVSMLKARAFTLEALTRGDTTVKESRLVCGLALELKVWPNKPSDEQLQIHELLQSAGWKVVVCYGLGEVEAEVKQYLQ